MTKLVTRAVYFDRPSDAVIAAFRKHVRQTGQPETFPTISTDKPPAETEVVALDEKIDVNSKLRPNKDYAPCAICSGATPKFLVGGILIWCPASKGIYFIGPECSSKLWKDGRLNVSLNVMRQDQTELAAKLRLAAIVADAPAIRAWITAHEDSAKKADDAYASLKAKCPLWARAVANALRGPSSTTPPIKGSSFLRGGMQLLASLLNARGKLDLVCERAGDDPDGWAQSLSASAVAADLGFVDEALEAIKAVHNRLATCATFFAKPNLDMIVNWAKLESRPLNYRAYWTGNVVEIHVDDTKDIGRCLAGFPGPHPLPLSAGFNK